MISLKTEHPNDGRWFGAIVEDGRLADDANAGLTEAQRSAASRLLDGEATRRGPVQMRVVVDVYENGEAVPQVQFPRGGSIDPMDTDRVNEGVARAAAAVEIRAIDPRKWGLGARISGETTGVSVASSGVRGCHWR